MVIEMKNPSVTLLNGLNLCVILIIQVQGLHFNEKPFNKLTREKVLFRFKIYCLAINNVLYISSSYINHHLAYSLFMCKFKWRHFGSSD